MEYKCTLEFKLTTRGIIFPNADNRDALYKRFLVDNLKSTDLPIGKISNIQSKIKQVKKEGKI